MLNICLVGGSLGVAARAHRLYAVHACLHVLWLLRSSPHGQRRDREERTAQLIADAVLEEATSWRSHVTTVTQAAVNAERNTGAMELVAIEKRHVLEVTRAVNEAVASTCYSAAGGMNRRGLSKARAYI